MLPQVGITYFDLQPGLIVHKDGFGTFVVTEVVVLEADTETVVIKYWWLKDEAEPFKVRLMTGDYNDELLFRGVLGSYFEYLDQSKRQWHSANERELAWIEMLQTLGGTLI